MSRRAKAPALRGELHRLGNRIAAVQANAGRHVSDAMLERLVGAQEAVHAALGKESYLTAWLDSLEAEIRGLHVNRPGGCGCGVCGVCRTKDTRPKQPDHCPACGAPEKKGKLGFSNLAPYSRLCVGCLGKAAS